MSKYKIIRIIQIIILLPILIVCPSLGQKIWKAKIKERKHWEKTIENFKKDK